MTVVVSGTHGTVGREVARVVPGADTVDVRFGRPLTDAQRAKFDSCAAFVHCGGLLAGSFDELLAANGLLVDDLLKYFSGHNRHAHLVLLGSMSVLAPGALVRASDYLPFKQMTDYAASKYLAEVIASRYSLPITVTRFSTLFCRDPRKDGLSRLVHDAATTKRIVLLNGGENLRDFLPVDVAAQYIGKIVANDAFKGRTMNLVSGQPISFRRIADFLQSKIPDLVVENQPASNLGTVPSRFATDDVQLLGRIEFDLFDEVGKYLESLLRGARSI